MKNWNITEYRKFTETVYGDWFCFITYKERKALLVQYTNSICEIGYTNCKHFSRRTLDRLCQDLKKTGIRRYSSELYNVDHWIKDQIKKIGE